MQVTVKCEQTIAGVGPKGYVVTVEKTTMVEHLIRNGRLTLVEAAPPPPPELDITVVENDADDGVVDDDESSDDDVSHHEPHVYRWGNTEGDEDD